MRGLLDINVLIALMDADHAFHEKAHDWYAQNRHSGWASCPMTENGLVRILSNPRYHPQKKHAPSEIISALQSFVKHSDHVFWADDLSLREPSAFLSEKILGPRNITDLYLLGLATKNEGCLVTFDTGIGMAAIPKAKPLNLKVIGCN